MPRVSSNIRFIKRERLIEFLKRNPNKFSAYELVNIIKLCAETIMKIAKEEGLQLKERKHGKPKKKKPAAKEGFFNCNYKFEDVI